MSENDRERDERDEDERDEDEDEGAEARGPEDAEAAPDPNLPRNRAERRAAAKAARRGRSVNFAEGSLATPEEVAAADDALIGPMTSMGGDPKSLGVDPRRPKVPPRTMSRGTGNAEGVPEWAVRAGNFVSANRARIAAAVVGVVVIGGGLFGALTYTSRREARATSAYAAALTTMFAPILPEDPPADSPLRDVAWYHTAEERNRAALEGLRRAERENASSRVAPLVRLSEASLLYELGRYAEAKRLYQAVMGADLAGLEGRAIEGLAFTLESLGDLDGAMAQYRELQNAQGGIFRDQAQFYQARLLVRRNDNARAKDLLHGVIERVGHPAASDPTAAVQSALRDQALALLRDVDPSDQVIVQHDRANATSGGGGDEHGAGNDPLRGLPPELRQQLEKALRDRGQGAGGRH